MIFKFKDMSQTNLGVAEAFFIPAIDDPDVDGVRSIIFVFQQKRLRKERIRGFIANCSFLGRL